MYVNEKSYTIRQASVDKTYLLDLASYNGTPYIAAGSQSENKVYVYEDPIHMLSEKKDAVLVPSQILKVNAPNYVAFSTNGRYVAAENGTSFAVYDAETDKGYAYTAKAKLDSVTGHAAWMDGYRLEYVSNNKGYIIDFDGANPHTLAASSPNYLPMFSTNYHWLYDFTPTNTFDQTALLTPADQ
jgi:hypothetical protein